MNPKYSSEQKPGPTRHIYNVLGFFCLLLAVVGILLPVMPTTIFVILAAYFFAKGSERLHSWLISNKIFGTYLRNYREGRGMTVGSKLFSISFLWAGIIYSIFMTDLLWLKVLLFLIAVTVSIHIIWIKTYKRSNSGPEI